MSSYQLIVLHRNGIRQACTGSPQLFLMVVNVIKKIVERGLGFRNEKIYMPALLYADDGMLISTTTTSVWETEKMIEVLVSAPE